MEMTRLHVESPRRRLELRLVDAVLEGLRAKIEVPKPRHRLFLRWLAAEVSPQRVVVLTNDARHEDLRLRQSDVRKRLACLSHRDGLFHCQRLQVHHRQYAIHRRARAVSRSDIVIMLDDVCTLADADELRIMRPLNLRRSDFYETLHDSVTSYRRVPVGRQQRWLVEFVHSLSERHCTRDVLSCQHIFLAEFCEQDFANTLSVAIVSDPNQSIAILHTVGIGHTTALIEQQSVIPGRSIVDGKLRCEMAAAFEVVVVNKKQVARGQAADEEPRARALDRAGFGFAPCPSFVTGVTLPKKAAAGANEHPQAAISEFRDHALQRPLRCFHCAVKFPCLTFIGRDAHALKLLWSGKPFVNRLHGMRHRHDPFTGRKHRRLVHPESIRPLVADAKLGTEHRCRRVRIVADTGMHIMHCGCLVTPIEDVPQPSVGIDPERRIETASAIAQRQSHRLRHRERLSAIVTMGKHDCVFGSRLFWTTSEPCDKHAAFGCSLQPRNSLPRSFGNNQLVFGNQRRSRVERDHNHRQRSGYAKLFAQLQHHFRVLSRSITDGQLQHARKEVEIV